MSDLENVDVAALLQALDALPAGLEPLDASAMDGFLTGMVLQRVPLSAAWRWMLDPEDRAPAVTADDPSVARALNVLESRHQQLDRAVEQRSWWDPWIFETDDAEAPDPIGEACLPWAAGFALAMDHFPALMQLDAAEVIDALALIYTHFDPDDLEDAEALLDAIEDNEPPQTLEEAVEDLVSASLCLADLSRPRRAPLRAAPSRGRSRKPRRR